MLKPAGPWMDPYFHLLIHCILIAKLQDLTTNPILRTYNLFKKEFRWENYLSCVQNPQYRNTLTKFRTSSHTLEIERGRHTNPITPVEQRLCNVYHVLEDELHFLLECNMFTDERTAFLYQIQNKYSQFITLDNKEKKYFPVTKWRYSSFNMDR